MTKIQNQNTQMKTTYPWWIYLIEGSVAIVLGFLLLFVPQDALVILVQILGIYLFIKGMLSLVSIFTHPGLWGWKLIVGLLGIVAGLLILNHPFITALSASILWVYVMAILAIVVGLIALIEAFAGAGWPSAILGLISVFLGILVLWQPIVVFLALPYIMGLLLLSGGILAILGALNIYLKVSQQHERVSQDIEAELLDTRPVVLLSGTERFETIEDQVEDLLPEAQNLEIISEQPIQEENFVLAVDEQAEREVSSADEETGITPEVEDVGWALESEGEEEGEGASLITGSGLASVVVAAAVDQEGGEEEVPEEVIETSEEDLVTEDRMYLLDEHTESVADILVTGEIVNGPSGIQEPDGESEHVISEVSDLGSTSDLADQESKLDDQQKRLLDRKVESMEGIGPVYAEKLGELGILTAHDLLQQGATRKGRMEIAEKTGISLKLIMRWTNQADLHRITGIGSEYSELLEAAGVDTVVELATRNPENLYQAMITTNEEKNLVRQVPSLNKVEGWVNQAKALPRIIRY